MATNFQHSVGVTYKSDSGTLTSTTDTFTADGEMNYKGQIQPNTTDGQIDLSVVIANIRCMVLYSDQDLTIKSNSSTSPQETIHLKARVQLVWNTLHTEAKPYAGNITAFFVTTGNISAPASVVFTHLIDFTPVLADPG